MKEKLDHIIDLLKDEESMLKERIRFGEWRFPYIPLEAVTSTDEDLLPSNSGLSVWDVVLAHPHY